MPAARLVDAWYERLRQRLSAARLVRGRGVVRGVHGWAVRTTPLLAGADEHVLVQGTGGKWYHGCLVSPGADAAQVMLLDQARDVRPGLPVEALGVPLSVPVGRAVLGRVLDPLGRPLDGREPVLGPGRPLFGAAPAPLERRCRRTVLWTGVRALDGFLTCARGQRVGILGAPGTGKTVLLRMIARFAVADVVVVALVGERGREIVEAADELLAERPSAVVVATPPNAPPALRRLTPYAATAVAEHFRDQGADVVLAVDSLTRLAHAQRELGLVLDELPAVRAYPASVFTMIPELIERAGPSTRGTITGFYAVLLEGEDLTEPICDVTLASLDGHVVLSRELANAGLYPPVDVLTSLSRLMRDVADGEHLEAAMRLRRVLQARQERRDLIDTGLYRPGTHRQADEGIRLLPRVQALLSQVPGDRADPEATRRALLELATTAGGDGA